MKELTLDYMKSLVFNYIDGECSKADFVTVMLEHINLLQILIEKDKIEFEKLSDKAFVREIGMREMPKVTGKDAERFLEMVERNNKSLEERNKHLKKAIETTKKNK